MSMFKKGKDKHGPDRYAGLNEQQRLQMRLFEQKQAEAKARFEEVLVDFKNEYNLLVKKYGCIHTGRLVVDQFAGIRPDVVIIDCWAQVKAQEEREKNEVVVPRGERPEVVV